MSNYKIDLFTEKKMRGKFGWWFRFWIRFLLAAEITKEP